ncbi:tRNA (adenosine(37)-N6)-threonylcarbamoyltransferase complex ATPase subunit type 1 TsaE [Virgibacillus sp. MSP4-1]|uniref:tRNA (adenosine(37)-N6)-threonylcarbamoyltransferase complex ATPase subunit type 1 TsaE n=1 Tax=Virgibacillus sp. MSP4-1 TaxID=2700081 RepID=UPI0003AAD197|nr:tRNA (adenosine(37)-N6)-threonylcarbamoyltransferase complex ATPase subunit type 1 TsaE [Virgibacillus sp. MSP4-1]QHS24128.1 tRNA (adenosine(37)-N6)-threonylcarbamoyltransferase complex ATPase subunit type 1 TsaE [Virgibacillus sp. MSP4-1]
MNSYQIRSKSADETMAFASRLAKQLQPGDVITLEGNLGAGKTTFTKGLAKGLDIKRTVNSPTFTIIKEYEGIYPLYHIDAYRLGDHEEDLGLDEYFEGDGITVVEWAKFIEDELPEEYINIQIRYTEDDGRFIELNPIGERFEKLCRELVE